MPPLHCLTDKLTAALRSVVVVICYCEVAAFLKVTAGTEWYPPFFSSWYCLESKMPPYINSQRVWYYCYLFSTVQLSQHTSFPQFALTKGPIAQSTDKAKIKQRPRKSDLMALDDKQGFTKVNTVHSNCMTIHLHLIVMRLFTQNDKR